MVMIFSTCLHETEWAAREHQALEVEAAHEHVDALVDLAQHIL